jgi:nucleotide-binding universal stress UspA family protein
MIKHILLATDGSTAAERAADFAASLALRFGAELTLLYAEGPPPRRSEATGAAIVAPQAPESAQVFLSRLVGRLHELGIAGVDTEVVEGPAVNVIIGVAETHRPDVLVLGARGWGTWQGPGLGSVSMAVLQRAECPVMVVK